MPVEILIHATAHRKAVKGQIQSIRDADDLIANPWGLKEGPPNYVILEIPNATRAQIENYLDPIHNNFQWEELAENAQGRRYRVWMHAGMASFNVSKGIRAELRDLLINEYGAQVVSFTPPFEAVVDIPNTDWQALRDRVLDVFDEQLYSRRWFFDPVDVDLAIANGGRARLNRTQAAARIIDRLA